MHKIVDLRDQIRSLDCIVLSDHVSLRHGLVSVHILDGSKSSNQKSN